MVWHPPAQDRAKLSPQAQQEFNDPHYGWDATVAAVDRTAAELAKAIEAWATRDREAPALYALAGRVQLHARALSANAAHLARLEALQ